MPYDPNANLYAQQQQSPMQGGQLDPALVAQVLALQQQGAQQAGITRQQKLADALRADAGSQLQGVQAGRRFVAPGAANMAANLLGNYVGLQQSGAADTAQKQLGTQKAGAVKSFWDMLNARNSNKTVPEAAGGVGGYGSDY